LTKNSRLAGRFTDRGSGTTADVRQNSEKIKKVTAITDRDAFFARLMRDRPRMAVVSNRR
jgi:hypothetical protein